MTRKLVPSALFAGLIVWLAHSHPYLVLHPAVMVPGFLLLTLGPAVWRLWSGLSAPGKDDRWIDRRVD